MDPLETVMQLVITKYSSLLRITSNVGVGLLSLDRRAAEARFVQDRFANGYWIGSQTSENLEEW